MYPHPEDTTITLVRNDEDGSVKGQLRVLNPGEKVWLVQSWVEYNNQKFSMVFPSLVRLEPKSSLTLTVYPIVEKNNINKWLVVKFIPSVTNDNDSLLTIPVSYKLKILEQK
ncbi:fimbria/pilus periplasmic chaperone [Escherichia coli]|nr:fimbria/pilus periplasmic chaperone [Escherichia coli]